MLITKYGAGFAGSDLAVFTVVPELAAVTLPSLPTTPLTVPLLSRTTVPGSAVTGFPGSASVTLPGVAAVILPFLSTAPVIVPFSSFTTSPGLAAVIALPSLSTFVPDQRESRRHCPSRR